MDKKKMDRMEQTLQNNKKPPQKNMMGALKKHFKGDHDGEEMSEEKKDKFKKNKHMDKDSRKKMAVVLIKKKMA